MQKKKEELEKKFLEITKQIGQAQQQLQGLANEKMRLEGEYRLVEELIKNKNAKKTD
jgi:chromosome segregation ATPase